MNPRNVSVFLRVSWGSCPPGQSLNPPGPASLRKSSYISPHSQEPQWVKPYRFVTWPRLPLWAGCLTSPPGLNMARQQHPHLTFICGSHDIEHTEGTKRLPKLILFSFKKSLGLSTMNYQLLTLLSVLVTQLCLTLCNQMDYISPPSSSVHEILQARILEWVAFPFSRGFSRPRYQTWASHITGRYFTI